MPLPQNVSFEAGACLGIPALTAYRALTTDGSVAGKSVLVTGGAGGVGHYAIQLARLLGAREILTTISSEAKAGHARAAGADATINYKTENLVERVKALTGGRGVDRIVDLDIAGHGKLIPDLIAKDGIVAAYGTNNQQVGFEFTRMIMTGRRRALLHRLRAGQGRARGGDRAPDAAAGGGRAAARGGGDLSIGQDRRCARGGGAGPPHGQRGGDDVGSRGDT